MRPPVCAALVLVTRPGEAGQRLSAALRDRGQDALWWPAFDLMAPEDPEPLRTLWQRLAEFDLAIFVSPGAVRGLAALDLGGRWPASTAIAAPGHGTLQLALGLLPGAAAAPRLELAPQAGQGGSEALWEALSSRAPLPGRVLIVRAESGREWLAARLREAGVQVEYASVYRRVLHAPAPEVRAALSACRSVGMAAAPLVTSTEAVEALDRQFDQAADERAWLRHGAALCTHARIAAALQTAGYGRVVQCEPTPASVLQAMQDGPGPTAACLLAAAASP